MSNSASANAQVNGRAPLVRLYLVRGVLAVVWAVAFAHAHDTLGAAAITLLVAYPLLDAVSSAVDYLSVPDGPEQRVTAFNGALSTLVALGLGVAGSTHKVSAVLGVFGAWAVVSGAAQVAVGIRRRGPELGRQWPMLVAGGLSTVAGVFYDIQAAGHEPSLDVLSVYATGGGVFFIVQAGLLVWKARRGVAQLRV
ncbi:DUF308 domain-containing protein [Kitasatospora aureofaciens]|uniref:DUF308 domain-containing protein n=1 Tax=Kitasatospora aureofaciens TaxID=1894 RepID=UPI0036F4A8FE